MSVIIAGAAIAAPFNPIKSIEFNPENILTSADFKQPRKSQLEKLFDRLCEFLNQPGDPNA